jgi:outer membrane protein assembly factor BamB
LPGELFALTPPSRRAPIALYHRAIAPDRASSWLSRIDTDGAPRWSVPLERDASIETSCADEDRILVREPARVRALGNATGFLLWNVPLAPTPAETVLSCPSTSRVVFALTLGSGVAGGVEQHLRAIDRRTGEIVWEVTPPEPPSADLQWVDDHYLLTSQYADPFVYRVLDARDGHEIRSEAHPAERGYLFAGPGALYRLLIADNTVFRIQRIVPATGKVLWSFEVTENAFFLLRPEQDGVKVFLSSKVLALSAATGDVRWSVPMSVSFETFPSLARFRSGDYAVTNRDYGARVADLVLVHARTGAVRWERRGVPFKHGSSLFEGFDGRVYTGVDDVLQRVDPRDGRSLATITHPDLAAYALLDASDDAMYFPHSFESLEMRYGIYKLDASTGDVVWKSRVIVMGAPLGARDRERLYFTGGGSRALLR